MSDLPAPRALFDEIIGLVDRGDLRAAEDRCRGGLEQHPRDVNLMGLLGATLLRQHRVDDAERCLRETIELAPSFAKPHEDLGILLLGRNRAAEAEVLLRKAVHLDATADVAWLNLGKALARLGRGSEADTAFEQSFALSPARRAMAEAAQAHREGRNDEAERQYRRILQADPKNVDALRMLAMIAIQAGRASDAERLLLRAIALAPDYTIAIIDLGRIHKEQERIEEAITQFREATRQEPENIQAHMLLAASLAQAALTEESTLAYRRTLELEPRHAAAWLGLGHALKTLGEQDPGIAAYRRCIELKPDNGEVYWSLANLKTYRFGDAELQEMETRAEREDGDALSRVNFLFALAKAHEDRGDLDRAWDYYRRGNVSQRQLVHYDPVHVEVANDTLIEVFDAGLLARHAGQGNPDPSPIFVLGLPRSGSTLIEQILASHSQVEGTSELPYIGRVSTSLNRNRADGINYPHAVRELEARHLHALGQDYLRAAQLHRRLGRPRFIDKMPNNFPSVGFIHLILPNARIIDARRHPLDACVANFRQLYAKGQTFSYELTELGEYYLQYQRMMDHWDAVLPGRVLRVQYEDTVMDLETQVRRILEFCGLPFEEQCLRYHETDRPVRTASSEQVRQPIYTTAIGQWRRYEKHLGELIEVLEPILPRYAK